MKSQGTIRIWACAVLAGALISGLVARADDSKATGTVPAAAAADAAPAASHEHKKKPAKRRPRAAKPDESAAPDGSVTTRAIPAMPR